MHHLTATYDKVLSYLKDALGENPLLHQRKVRPGPKYRFSDMEIIALTLTADYLGLNSENYLFVALNADYRESFPDLLSRRQYNDRRRRLKDQISLLQKAISDRMKKSRKSQDVYVVDSAPLRLCKNSRRLRSTICKDDVNLLPDIAWCAAQEEYFYGFRLNMVCTGEGVIKAFKVEKPNMDEREYLYEIAKGFEGCRIVGDKGYISQERKKYLLEQHNIVLETPYRKNMKNPKPFLYSKDRKRIETIFSQLNDQFQIQRNYAKVIDGYLARIYSKICSMTLMHFINFAKGNTIGKVQYSLM